MKLSDNYFEIFGLPVSTAPDAGAIDEAYKRLQREWHPDRFSAGSDEEKRRAMQYTSVINQARQTLTDPLARAIYLLSLKGVDLDAETDTRMRPEFLMAQMELRERLELVDGAADPYAAIDKLRDEVAVHARDTATTFAAAWEGDDTAGARDLAREWQFLDKLRRELDEKEQRLDGD
ncbi:Fe-S protein assembly co-chaperone HscB [Granulosicoccaceae sp. 1_MG-2023]|nr:Fe-S protein assembly co-chaperone HscB [Granulosicoccaceae sp. 1_MG-2023]